MTVQSRPTGVTILAVLAAISGVLGLLAGLALIGLGGVAGAATGSAAFGGLVAIFGLLALVTGVLNVAFAYGAWTLKPWGWTLGMIAAGLAIVSAVLGFVNDSNTLSSQLISIVIAGVIIYYLNTPGVKAAFGRA